MEETSVGSGSLAGASVAGLLTPGQGCAGAVPAEEGASGRKQRSPFTEGISRFSTQNGAAAMPAVPLAWGPSLPAAAASSAGQGFSCNSFCEQRRELKTKSGFFFLLVHYE